MTNKIPLVLMFTVFVSILFAQPDNDDCIDAIEFANLDGECISFNSTMSTFDIANGDCVLNASNMNIWFNFVAQGTDIDISANGQANDIFVTLIAFDPSPCDFASVTQLACGFANGGDDAISLVGALTIGNTYYIIASVRDNVETEGTICIDNPDPNAVPIPIPTLSQWGLISLALCLLILGTSTIKQLIVA